MGELRLIQKIDRISNVGIVLREMKGTIKMEEMELLDESQRESQKGDGFMMWERRIWKEEELWYGPKYGGSGTELRNR